MQLIIGGLIIFSPRVYMTIYAHVANTVDKITPE